MRRFFAATLLGFSLVASFGLTGLAQAATAVPQKPTNSPVVDQANVIDEPTEGRIDSTVKAYEQKTGNQIAVLTIKSLDGEDIEGYSYRVASAWGIGDKTANNGELIVVAVDDRKVRIEVGRGLEPYLTDLQSYRIIQDYMIPEFRSGSYARGIEIGVQKSIDVIGGERLSGTGATAPKKSGMGDIVGMLFYVAIFPLMYLGSFLARSKSWWAGGLIGAVPGLLIMILAGALLAGGAALVIGLLIGLLLDYLLSRNYQERKTSGDDTGWWGSGGGFFGGSSGGFGGSSGGWGGFGGGSFGGGGSSGSW